MRTVLVGLIGLLSLSMSGCLLTPPREADMSAQMFQQMQQGKPIVMEQGKRIDESKARNIQTGVHTKQDIETWFGKTQFKNPLDYKNSEVPNYQHPHGCLEMWNYMHTLTSSQVNGPSIMMMESLNVFFNKDGKVCGWSLMRKPQNMTIESITGRPIDVPKAKNIQSDVQTKIDIETWFGKPTSIGFEKYLNDPKDCLELWTYEHMDAGQGKSGGTSETLSVKFNEQGKVCHSDYSTMNF
ncbi:MAG: hypothetical protein AB7T38_09085 [Nitrospirales bacterium]